MSLKDKSDLFFYDYSLHPLFIQENYISASPHAGLVANKFYMFLSFSFQKGTLYLIDGIDFIAIVVGYNLLL